MEKIKAMSEQEFNTHIDKQTEKFKAEMEKLTEVRWSGSQGKLPRCLHIFSRALCRVAGVAAQM